MRRLRIRCAASAGAASTPHTSSTAASAETPLRAHSLYFDVLAETGVQGLLILLLGVGAPLLLLARRLSQPCAVAAFGAGTYFLAHAAVDWIWTLPAVGVPAFVLLGIGCAGGDLRPLPRRAAYAVGSRRSRRRATGICPALARASICPCRVLELLAGG